MRQWNEATMDSNNKYADDLTLSTEGRPLAFRVTADDLQFSFFDI